MKNLYKEITTEEIKQYFNNNKDKILHYLDLIGNTSTIYINDKCYQLIFLFDNINNFLFIRNFDEINNFVKLDDYIYGIKYRKCIKNRFYI
jgi:hypothetical protein